MDLLLLHRLLILFVLLLLLKFNSLDLFECGHISIENLPLSGLQRERRALRRVCLDTLLFDGKIECLGGAFLEVKLVAKRLLLGFVIALEGVLAELLLDGHIHFVKETLIALLFVLPILLLISGFIRILEDVITIEGEVENKLIN